MMKNKVLATVFGGLLLIAAANPPKIYTEPLPLTTAIEFCRVAHAKFQAGDNGAFLAQGMARLGEQNRKGVAVVCYVYGEAFSDGRRVNTT